MRQTGTYCDHCQFRGDRSREQLCPQTALDGAFDMAQMFSGLRITGYHIDTETDTAAVITPEGQIPVAKALAVKMAPQVRACIEFVQEHGQRPPDELLDSQD